MDSGTERQGDRARDRRQEIEEPPESRAKDPRQTQRDTQGPEIVETHGLRDSRWTQSQREIHGQGVRVRREPEKCSQRGKERETEKGKEEVEQQAGHREKGQVEVWGHATHSESRALLTSQDLGLWWEESLL